MKEIRKINEGNYRLITIAIVMTNSNSLRVLLFRVHVYMSLYMIVSHSFMILLVYPVKILISPSCSSFLFHSFLPRFSSLLHPKQLISFFFPPSLFLSFSFILRIICFISSSFACLESAIFSFLPCSVCEIMIFYA